jgi:hypothetical protein
MELAGLKSRLARAEKQEADLALTGERFDKVLDDIDDLHGALEKPCRPARGLPGSS